MIPTTSQGIFGRMTFLTAANLLGAVMGFLAVVIIARHYGAAALGLISLALTLVNFGRTITRFGTDQYGVRQIASGNERAESAMGKVILLRLAAGLASFSLLLALPLAAEQFRDVHGLLAILGLLLFVAMFRLDWVCQAFHRSNIYGLVQVSIQGLYLLLVTVAVTLSLDLWSVAASQVLAELLVVSALYAWVTRNLSAPDFHQRRSDVLAFARASAPITGTQLLRSLCLPSDIILLGLLVTAAELGLYSVAFRIFLFAQSLISAYFVIVLPRFAAHANAPTETMSTELRDSLRRSLPFVLAGSALLALMAKPSLSLLFGPSYTAASHSLQLLCVALVLNLLNRHYRQVLIVSGRQARDFRVTVMGTGVHIVSKLALIPVLGIAGAALGSVIGELVLLFALRRAAAPALKPSA